MTSLPPEKTKLVVDQLVDSIREGIIGGRYAPGQRLVEADMTAEFGVSRAPVRDAFGRLATEGLLEMSPHRGARVRRYSDMEIIALFEVREALEGLAARSAARNARLGTPIRREIEALHHQMDTAISDGRIEDYMRLNRTFHDVVVEAADNPLLTPMLRQLQTQALRTLFQSRMDLDLLRRSMDGHDLIVQCILTGDEDGAEKAMRAHVRASRDQLARAAQRAQAAPLRANH